eukprot:gnl/TRDRNA2_/TRDRNA2_191116_c0_seq1.p1 gnl/TRDRNA2_/TRDRNA2_191116_c0~~gnl/TRDRNA2_/TRDRNA2_191116_c0_seq1.p1  ORF type:complete len:180 (+),score=33.89 gnl/TRDRNA2_/TRDRNA2_191116_c0_seq1:43-582(+)
MAIIMRVISLALLVIAAHCSVASWFRGAKHDTPTVEKLLRDASRGRNAKYEDKRPEDDDLDAVGPCHEKLSCSTINLIEETGWCEHYPNICGAIEKGKTFQYKHEIARRLTAKKTAAHKEKHAHAEQRGRTVQEQRKTDTDLDAIGPCHPQLSCRTVKLIKDANWCEYHPRICKAIDVA